MERKKRKEDEGTPRSSFAMGAIALMFLIIGYQIALFVHKAVVGRVSEANDRPDTVFVIDRALAESILSSLSDAEADSLKSVAGLTRDAGAPRGGYGDVTVRRVHAHPRVAERPAVYGRPARRVESFDFDPNTVSVEDLQRLGFSPKQAQAIENYRSKGGRFHRPEDFSRSFVVSDSVYRRLEPFIAIPKIDINTADSALFELLPGIGKYFASRMVSYRRELHGYSHTAQLMEIYNFSEEKYEALSDLITLSPPEPYPLWTLPEDSLALHPYIGRRAAHGIVLYRDNQPCGEWTVEGLKKAGVLDEESAGRLSKCRIAAPL